MCDDCAWNTTTLPGLKNHEQTWNRFFSDTIQIPTEPGDVSLLSWPVRTGKTYQIAEWIAKHQTEYKIVFITPTLGDDLTDPSKSVAANFINELNGRGIPWIVAAGKDRTCDLWSNHNIPDNIPYPLRHREKTAEQCRTCPAAQSISNARDHPQQSNNPVPDSTGNPPYGNVRRAGICTKYRGLQQLLDLDPADPTVGITSPPFFRQAVRAAEDAEELDEWTDNLIVIWDEAHRDNFFLKQASLQPYDVPAGHNQDTPPLPEFLGTLPPAIEDWARDVHQKIVNSGPATWDLDFYDYLADFDAFRIDVKDALESLAEVPWDIYQEFTRWHDSNLRLFQTIQRWSEEQRTGNELANKIRDILNRHQNNPHLQPYKNHIQSWAYYHQTKNGSSPPGPRDYGFPEPAFSRYGSGSWKWQLQELIDPPPYDTNLSLAQELYDLPSPEAVDELVHRRGGAVPTWEGAPYRHRDLKRVVAEYAGEDRIEDVLQILTNRARDSESDDGYWSRLLPFLQSGQSGALWCTYTTTRHKNTLGFSIQSYNATWNPPDTFDYLRKRYTGPVLEPAYGPFNMALRAGAAAVLLTATPQPKDEIERFLQGRDLRRIPFPPGRDHPELRVAIEKKKRSINNAIRRDSEGNLQLNHQVRKILEGIRAQTNGDVHYVARSKEEYQALQNAGLAAYERLHYFRDADSLGVQWNASNLFDPDEESVIVALGPPKLPPNLWTSHPGLAYRMEEDDRRHNTLSASRGYQEERMAMEFWQTVSRGVQVSLPGQDKVKGKVVLLAGKHDQETLDEYADEWGLDVEWEEVDPQAWKNRRQRGQQLPAKARGTVLLQDQHKEIIGAIQQSPKSKVSKKQLKKKHGRHNDTWKKAIDELEGHGYIEEKRKGGKTGRTVFYGPGNKMSDP